MIILDLALLVMIGLCIWYCWTLNRRIHDLQNSRIEFARMIKELNVSIIKAESSIAELNEISKVTSSELKTSIEDAKTAVSELVSINAISNNLADALDGQIKSLQLDRKNISVAAVESKIDAQPNQVEGFFSDEDFEVDAGEGQKVSYSNQLKHFITSISKKAEEPLNLNQLNYYDTLRKVSAKK